MSYDVRIATRDRPTAAQLEGWIAHERGLRATAPAGERGVASVIERRTLLRWEHLATIDVAVRAERGDLDDALAGVVRGPCWLTELHVPYGQVDRALLIVSRLAAALAEANGGAAFDPQTERLVWPAGPTGPIRPTREHRIRHLSLEWFIPNRLAVDDVPSRLVRMLATRWPAALPRRFGTFEPPQERFEGAGREEAFAAYWHAQREIEYGSSLFWTATRPFLGGSIFLPDRRDDYRPAGAGRALLLRMSVDGSRVAADAGSLEEVVDLFNALAGELDAAYGAAFVERDVLLRRGISYGRGSEIYPRMIGPWFVGIPPEPTWLAWYGPDYAPLVRNALPAETVTEFGDRIAVRWGRLPMDLDELADVPALPGDLLLERRDGAQVQAAFVPEMG